MVRTVTRLKKQTFIFLVILFVAQPFFSFAVQQDIDTLLKQLNSDNPPLQAEAAKNLAVIKDDKAAQGLIITLKTGNSIAKRHAVKILSERQDPRSLDTLRDAMADKDEVVSSYARTAVRKFGEQAKESLKAGLKSGDWNVRFACAEMLASMGDRSGVDVFLEAMNRGGHDQMKAFDALSGMNEKRALQPLIKVLVHIDRKTRKKAQDILTKWMLKSPEIIPEVLSTLRKTDNVELQKEIIYSLSRSNTPEVIRELSGFVKNPHTELRLAAVQSIGLLKNREGIPALVTAIEDSDRQVKRQATAALSTMKDKRAIKPLMQFLREAKETDQLVINSLGNFGKDIAPEILPLLKDRDKNVRRSAAQVLGVLGATRSVENLITVLKDPAPEVRAAAAQALGRFQDKRAIPPLVNAVNDPHRDVQEQAIYALVSMGNKTVSYLSSMWQSDDEKQRQKAIFLLGKMGNERSLDIIRGALEDPNVQIRTEAAKVLAEFGDKGVDLLLKALDDHEVSVRKAAVYSLAAIRNPRAVKPLLSKLNTEIKTDVLYALSSIGSMESVPVLLSLLKDRDSTVRALAAEALGETGDIKTAQKIIPLLSDKNIDVQMAAAQALGKLKDPSVTRQLTALLSGKDIRVRRTAAQALGTAGDKDAVQPLMESLQSDDNLLVWHALTAINLILQRTKTGLEAGEQQIQTVIGLLNSADDATRIQAGTLLSYIGSKAVDPLMNIARSGDKVSRIGAINTLGEIRDKRALDLLLELIEEKDVDIQRPAITALGKLKDPKAVSPLIKKLNSEDPEVRGLAVAALGNIGDTKAVAALVKMMLDDDERVRKKVGEALEKLTGEKCPFIEAVSGFAWFYPVLFGIIIAIIIVPTIRQRIKPVDNVIKSISQSFGFMNNERVQWWLALVFGIVALAFFIYCTFHEIAIPSIQKGGENFFENLYLFVLKVFPFFVGGALVSGLMMKYLSRRNILPKSMLGASLLASLLPLCSCGVVPLSRAMLSLSIPKRTVIAFLVVAPILNPFVIFMSYGVIGIQYTLLRILGTFALAFAAGIFIEKFTGQEEIDESAPICRLCKSCVSPAASGSASSGLVAGWQLMLYLKRYIAIGVIAGALISTYVPVMMVSKYLSSNVLGLLLSVTIGIPIFLCSGEEIVMLKPLLDMGLPMGHAVAFTIAANGICVSSIALLTGVLGKKTTTLLTLSFWVGSFLLGLGINLIFR